MADEKIESTDARDPYGDDVVPELMELTDRGLFGDLWTRTELRPRDRCLITCAALVATGKTESLRFHFPEAVANGVSKQELMALVTQLTFHAGWRSTISAALLARELFESDGS